jgi:hypothetical protein
MADAVVQPSLPCPDVSDIRDPDLVRTDNVENSLTDLVDPHQASHPILATCLSRLPEIQEDAWRPVDAVTEA